MSEALLASALQVEKMLRITTELSKNRRATLRHPETVKNRTRALASLEIRARSEASWDHARGDLILGAGDPIVSTLCAS